MTETALQVGSGQHTYLWHDNWARLPDSPSHKDNGRTHGVAVTKAGKVVVFCQADPAVLIFGADGSLESSWGDRFAGAHGLTLVEENGEEFLWLTDQNSGEVVKTTLDGTTVQSVDKPAAEAYAGDGKYSPTWVAVNPSNGDIWVADGYGQSYVSRYDKDGKYLGAISGEEDGALGRFKCPHGIAFDTRGGTTELYITDRGNSRLQIYDVDGGFLRGVTDVFHSPCCFDFHSEHMLVPELQTGVKLVDGDDRVLVDIGENRPVAKVDGWPNLAGTEHVQPGRFNSPHGGCFDADGNIYVVEWIVGGRITKLERQ